jgi:protein subunit release factor A
MKAGGYCWGALEKLSEANDKADYHEREIEQLVAPPKPQSDQKHVWEARKEATGGTSGKRIFFFP